MQMVAQVLLTTGALTATGEMFHLLLTLCLLLSYCMYPFSSSPLSIQMLFSKHKSYIVTKCQLNIDLEQVKIALEVSILVPKEALTGLN